MKKYINTAMVYAILAMCSGVFFREFTKIRAFQGETMLGFAHPHLFALGTCVFLIAALFVRGQENLPVKPFKSFYIVYNIGLIGTSIMMIVRGVLQVLGTELGKGVNGMISGIAGLAHITTAVGIVLLLLALKKTAKN